MKKTFTLIYTLLLCVTTYAQQLDFNKQENMMMKIRTELIDIYESKSDYKSAIYWTKNLITKHYTPAFKKLASFYDEGKGVEMDVNKSSLLINAAKYNKVLDEKYAYKYLMHVDQDLANAYINQDVYLENYMEDLKKDVTAAPKKLEYDSDNKFINTLCGVIDGSTEAMIKMGDYFKKEKGFGYNYTSQVFEYNNYSKYWYFMAASLGDAEIKYQIALRFDKRDKEYLTLMLESANLGYEDAQKKLVEFYLNKDKKQAIVWLLDMADKGNEDAQKKLVELYRHKDKKLAVTWLQKLAQNGDEESMLELAEWYRKGNGVKKDSEKELFWLKSAVARGNATAMFRLAEKYSSDNDHKREMYWLKKSIEKGEIVGSTSVNNYTSLGFIYKYELDDSRRSGLMNDAFEAAAKEDKKKVHENLLYVDEKLATNYKNGTTSDVYDENNFMAEIKKEIGYVDDVVLSNKKAAEPPIIQMVSGSMEFVDMSGNNAIDAGENCSIRFKVRNIGKGDAVNCVARAVSSVPGVSAQEVKIKKIAAGETTDVEIPVNADGNIKDGHVEFEVAVDEPNGCGSEDVMLNVNTRALEYPYIKVVDYSVADNDGGMLKKMHPFSVKMMLQNINKGMAENVRVSVILPDNVLLVNGKVNENFASLYGGQVKEMNIEIMANKNYPASVIPINVIINEKYGKYAESKTINLELNNKLSEKRIVVDEIHNNDTDIELAQIHDEGGFSDVDINIPTATSQNKNTFAVIIANENYENEAKVDYALNDGETVKKYMHQVLGIPAKNVRMVKDATLNNMLGNVEWLKQVAESYGGEANIIFYYAGHGVPDENSRDAFLLPVDGYGSNIRTGYKLIELIQELSKYPTKQTLVFLDACFSGAQRNGMMMASARAVGITQRKLEPKGNMVLFSAAQGSETAYPFKEKKHGLFTYFLLKKLQQTRGDVSLGDLCDYITVNVKRESIVTNTKRQTPSVQSAMQIKNVWRNMKLK